MEGTRPHPLDADQVLAYVDGDATSEAALHIQVCADCRALAHGYGATQRRLRGMLSRFACPSPDELGEYELGIAGPEMRPRLAAHVAACPRCQEELRALRAMLREDLVAPAQRPLERLRRIVATLVPPPAVAYAALRGGEPESRTYRAEDVVITVGPGPILTTGQPLAIAGLIWRETGEPGDVVAGSVRLVQPDGTEEAAEIDDLGGFAFDRIRPGIYELQIDLGDTTIIVPGVRSSRSGY